jgi:hypothetical protein
MLLLKFFKFYKIKDLFNFHALFFFAFFVVNMSNSGPPSANLNQLAQTIAQYKQNMEFLNNNILTLRQNLERPDISNEDKEILKKQEQELQSKLVIFQTLIASMGSQLYAQQRAMLSPETTPGSPASVFSRQQPLQNKMTFTTTQNASPQLTTFASPAANNNGSSMFTFPVNSAAENVPSLRNVPSVDNDGVSRVLTKRKIQELVTQIDPSERLEPEVEDVRVLYSINDT